jgi:HK97 family phage prohead protease
VKAEIETRSGVVTDVRYPERVIDLVVVPYNQPAVVEYKGRLIEESFSPGAFGQGIEQRARTFLVNLEHDTDRVVGRCVALHASRQDGLVGEVRIRRGPEGDQVLDDADDGMIGASVGFAALPQHQHWETRSHRRILKAFLDHIALTFSPAYTGAEVIAVRSATPNLDRVSLDELVARYSPPR